MKKLLTIVLFLTFGVTQAQLQEGNFMLGADLGNGLVSPASSGLFGLNVGLNDGAGWNVGVSPKAGYMMSDNFMLGAIVNLGFSKANEDASEVFVYGVQALTRFYVSPSEVNLEGDVPAGQFFLETNAGLAGVNQSGDASTNGFAFGFGPGYSYFLTDSVALDASVKYNGLVGAGSDNYQNSLGINLGIQIFLPRSSAEEAINDFD
ncbi:hypothetical protein RM545_01820 [Zunongwangia sp. F260]|uniref:Outer membrane protein beta-barrel domain-containing protein n=1 Tax=Autumnicola lenta TaxID=3075593 RepID=A0ABU3CGD8_9FLAO|nr:outer membrane beta-barrel protein [Zunongwangia sp. F260]MDT0645413.1 hypothetical protein [Zunongwangia sp. F260]